MSSLYQDGLNDNVVSIGASEAEELIRNLHSLRNQIVTAWRERAVIFSEEEQAQLHAEIRQTCEFLKDLTMLP